MQVISKMSAFRHFLSQVTKLSLPYFKSDQKWQARGLLLAIIVLNLGSVYLLVLIN